MNFLELTVQQDGSDWWLVGDDTKIAFDETRFIVQDGKDVTIGVRPSVLELGSDANRALAGECDLIEYHGDQTLVSFKVGEVQLRALVPSRNRPVEGDTVSFQVRPNASHLFDRQTEQSLL